MTTIGKCLLTTLLLIGNVINVHVLLAYLYNYTFMICIDIFIGDDIQCDTFTISEFGDSHDSYTYIVQLPSWSDYLMSVTACVGTLVVVHSKLLQYYERQ